jgi:molybdate transport system substrate-binding protein
MIVAIAFGQITIAQQPITATLTVSAGAGLKPVLTEIQQVYKQIQPNVTINYNFASSGSLQRQIEQGAKTDVFISASVEYMNALEKQGFLLSGSRTNLLKNGIALIAPKNSTAISSFQDLTKSTVKRIAIGEPRSVPVGKSAEEIFRYFKITDQVKPKILYTRNGPQILNYVETGSVDAGITHDSNAKQSNQVRIVALAPEKSYSPLVYPVAILKDSKNLTAARSFVQFLFSNQAKALFENYGYQMAN